MTAMKALSVIATWLVFFLVCVVHVDAKKRKVHKSSSFFDGDWSDIAWRAAKLGLALSPVIGVVYCCLFASESSEEEELKRRKKTDSAGC
mmetsp:Transcript_44833/g.86243  ORF Transcript_44833/g.86243 Transcript_44833/m.86243 type:complete len:90 (-) Transcript_44833:26-295(-)